MSSNLGKSLLEKLREHGLTEYGAAFHGDRARLWLGLAMPETGTKADFDNIALKELSAIDYCRNVLLDEGKYLSQDGQGYRILLPSENRAQVNAYMDHARNKMRRAQKLLRSMPTLDTDSTDYAANMEARIQMKIDGLKRKQYGSVEA
jgi:hypothetical protein